MALPTRILIADDDADLVTGLSWYLEAEGFEVRSANSGPAAIEAFRTSLPDVVILDIMMPGVDGVQVCETLRSESDAYIIMLSAKDGEFDKVRALDKGADDYVTKPFHTTELLARIKAHLRRSSPPESGRATYQWETLAVYAEERRVLVNARPVHLSSTEFDLLAALMRRSRMVFTREQIADILWEGEFYGELRLVDNHVYRLREKLTDAGLSPCPIVTVRGVGYAFRPED